MEKEQEQTVKSEENVKSEGLTFFDVLKQLTEDEIAKIKSSPSSLFDDLFSGGFALSKK